jgi:hypothetical protein
VQAPPLRGDHLTEPNLIPDPYGINCIGEQFPTLRSDETFVMQRRKKPPDRDNLAPLVRRSFIVEIIMNGLHKVSFREQVEDYLRPFPKHILKPERGERGQADDLFEVFSQIRIKTIPE